MLIEHWEDGLRTNEALVDEGFRGDLIAVLRIFYLAKRHPAG